MDSVTPSPTLPPIAVDEPTSRVAAFYYPWFRNPSVDGEWYGWDAPGIDPPLDISSDYYPLLGAYSTSDERTVSQHFAWLREAGVGVVIVSWWGQGSREDQAVSVLLRVAERYGIQVAFHIENYSSRTANRLIRDVEYIYARYGEEAAFYRTTTSSRWSPNDNPKGLFFLWDPFQPGQSEPGAQAVDASYWQPAVDSIHSMPQGSLVIACASDARWVDGGHFDGLYNYAVRHPDQSGRFAWAQRMPLGAWYVPSVGPGAAGQRIGRSPDEDVARRDGATYREQWESALSVGVEPQIVTITSFNEWGEGTQIEPAAAGATNGGSYTYADYGPLPPEGYLDLTRLLVDDFLARTWPDTTRLRVRLVTTSDWTTLNLVSGATWLRPDLISVSEEATNAALQDDGFVLDQPIARAEAGGMVEVIVDMLFTGWESGGTVVFEIARGHLGSTQVELSKYVDGEPVVIETFEWRGISGRRNTSTFQISAEMLFGATP